MRLLPSDEALSVLNTPLFEPVDEDAMVWWPENNGEYSVRSAYKLCLERILDTSHLMVEGDWEKLWRLKVPPKVKHFLWRTCRDCIPTRERLQTRGVHCPSNCPQCDCLVESSVHILLQCPSRICYWRRVQLWDVIAQHNRDMMTFKDIFFNVLDKLSTSDQQVFAMTLWSLWVGRNQKVREGVDESTSTMVGRGQVLLSDWSRTALRPVRQVEERHAPSVCLWKKLPTCFVKYNIDASFSQQINRVGVGLCLRDEFGLFMGAKTLWPQPILDVKVSEAVSLLKAMEWMRELNMENVIFKMDSQLVVNGLQNASNDKTEFGAILLVCRRLLSEYISNSHVEFTMRQANIVAHSLAKATVYNACSQFFPDMPTCIAHLIINEMH